MIIEWMDINKINIAEYNPRIDLQPGDPDYEDIKRSLDEFDLVEPLVINKRNSILIGGHQRLKILQARGDKKVQVSIVDLDDAHEKALNLALNKTGGEWDQDKLSALLSELTELSKIEDLPDFEFDMDLTGFDTAEIETTTFEPETKEPFDEDKQKEDPYDGFVSTAKKREAKRKVIVENFDIYSVSFSGGKDSALMSLLALEQLPKEKILLVYWDSGWNYEEETRYVYYFAQKYDLKLLICGFKNKDPIFEKMGISGYPFYGNLWCQTYLKSKSLKMVDQYIKKELKKTSLSLVGIRKTESRRRMDYPKFSKLGGEIIWFPVRNYTDECLIDYFKSHNEKINPMYNFTDRTGCVFCPNANVATRSFMKKYHPEELAIVNECIVEAMKDTGWSHLPDTVKLFNMRRTEKTVTTFKDIAFNLEEFRNIDIDISKLEITDLRE